MINQRFNPTLLTFAQHSGGEKKREKQTIVPRKVLFGARLFEK